MLVYDVTQARSFENINKWLRNIDDHASDDVVKMLIGNKWTINVVLLEHVAKH
jgi:GTPase SAR1 family protein